MRMFEYVSERADARNSQPDLFGHNVPVIVLAPPLIFDFAECPFALDEHGRAGWAQIFGVQAQVTMTQLQRELDRADTCPTCGAAPCINPSLACRRADRRAQAQSRRVVERRPTPEVTVEAIKQAVRTRGTAALDEPVTEQRLRDCDAAALIEIDRWLNKKGISR